MTVEGVVLAAGCSTRAGRFKMLLDIHGTSVIQRCINVLKTVSSRIIIVGGYEMESLLFLAERCDVELVRNEKYHQGMYSSVKTGLRRAKGECVFVVPGDCPAVGAGVYRRLLEAEGDVVVPAKEKRAGHPVLLRKRAVESLLADTSHQSLRDFIGAYGSKTVEVDDPGILMDIDTWEDYMHIKEYFLHTQPVGND